MRRSLFLPAIMLLVLQSSCDKEDDNNKDARVEWMKLGLDGYNVRELKQKGDLLFAATDDGLFVKSLQDNAEWEELGFAGEQVRSVLLADGYMLASVVGPQDTGLFKSNDEGESWDEVADNFGGNSPEPIFYLCREPDSGTIYGAGYATVARSSDEGVTWSPIYGDWQGFASGLDLVEVNPHNGDIWAGGQNAIEEMVLIQSEDNGATWQHWSNLVAAPSVAKDILFHADEAGHVYVGFEAALLKTEDNGSTWETLIDSEENRFFFGINQDPVNLNTLYAAGWLKRFEDPQPLILFISENDGNSWTEHVNPEEEFGGVNDMILRQEAGNTVLYMALWQGGVYKAVIN